MFTLMPGLLLLFSPLIDKTKHRNFVPSIKKIATFSIKGRKVIVPIFVIVAISSMYFSQQTEYIFSHSGARAKTLSEKQIQLDRINEIFGSTNGVGVMVPVGNYALESEFIEHMLSFDEVEDVLALASTEALDGYGLTDYLTSREFSELLDLDYELCQLLFANSNDELQALLPNLDSQLTDIVSSVNKFLNSFSSYSSKFGKVSSALQTALNSFSNSFSNLSFSFSDLNYSRELIENLFEKNSN